MRHLALPSGLSALPQLSVTGSFEKTLGEYVYDKLAQAGHASFPHVLLEKCTDHCGILFAFYFAKFMSSEKNEGTIIPLG